MSSGLAPGRVAPTNAAGNSMDGNSCCLSDGMAYTPKPVITIAIRATRPRLARLSRVRNDIGAPPVKVRPARIVCLTRTNGFPPGHAGTVRPSALRRRVGVDRERTAHRGHYGRPGTAPADV